MEQCLCGDPIALFLNHSKGYGNIHGHIWFFSNQKDNNRCNHEYSNHNNVVVTVIVQYL